MKSKYVESRLLELDAAIAKAKAAALDFELQSFLSSYLVVRIAGAYEDCVEHLVTERAGRSGDLEVEGFVREVVAKVFRSARFDNIKTVAGMYSDTYRRALEKRVDDKARAAIASIVNNRHDISHGKPSSVTLGDVETFHNNAKPVLVALDDILL